MPLVPRESLAPLTSRRQVTRVALASLGGGMVFVLLLSFAAWWTRDAAEGVPHDAPAPVDAGVALPLDAGVAQDGDGGVAPVEGDAGLGADGGAMSGAPSDVAGDVDGGPAQAALPPVAAGEVGEHVRRVGQACLVEALRFDPALGGRCRVVVALGGGARPQVQVRGVSSPFFVRCMETRLATARLPQPAERQRVEAALALDGLRSTAILENAELLPEVTTP